MKNFMWFFLFLALTLFSAVVFMYSLASVENLDFVKLFIALLYWRLTGDVWAVCKDAFKKLRCSVQLKG